MDRLKDCEAALRIAVVYARRGHEAMAATCADVLRRVEKDQSPFAQELAAAALFGLAAFDDAKGRHAEAQRRREQAVARLDRAPQPGESVAILDLIGEELMKMDENRKALPYCNQAVALTHGAPGLLGARLFFAGRCHRRVGFDEAALAQLREAVPLLRGDLRFPYLAAALLELGTLVFKSAPEEGAGALREAAGLYEASGDIANGGTCWLNLGVSLSQAGELDAALEAYEKAGAIRARNPATTPAQRGNIHNNLAGLWRRKRDFARARAEADEAIAILLTVGGEFLAHALGSRGEIARDEGETEAALSWFADARALYERLPGANREKLAVKLDNEAGALATLGRDAEAAKLRARVTALRGEVAPPAPAIPLDRIREDRKYAATVIVELDGRTLPGEVYASCDLATLEDLLEARLSEVGAGEVDGHVTGPDLTTVHLVGDDADAVLAAIGPVLRTYPLCENAQVELRQAESVRRIALDRRALH